MNGSILITGASSGLGAELARAYAAPGVVLGLIARNAGRLDAVAETCRKQGASVETGIIDVTDSAKLSGFTSAFDSAHPIELLLANAGVSAGTSEDGGFEGLKRASNQVRINLLGAMNTIEPLLPQMAARRAGRIGIVSSVAGLRGLPYSPGYSASKAGLRAYGEALRALLQPYGIAISVISPGFFETPMTERFIGNHPFCISVERAASIVRRGLDQRRSRIVFPKLLALGLRLTDLMPAVLGDAILRHNRFHILPSAGTES